MSKSAAVVPRVLHVATHADIGGAEKACLRILMLSVQQDVKVVYFAYRQAVMIL
jgi:hypothetical protein